MPTSAARSRLYFLQGFPWAIFREGHKVRHQLDGSTWTALSGCLAGLPGMSWGQAVAQQSSGPPPGARASTVTLLVEEQPEGGLLPGLRATTARAEQGAATCPPRGRAGFPSVRKGFCAGGCVARGVGRVLLGLALLADPSRPPAP